MILVHGQKLDPTIFPDKTSQVWKIDESFFNKQFLEIEWEYDSDAEIFYLCQIRDLFSNKNLSLSVPYLPYARQDKDVMNNSTFALHTFAKIINELRFIQITTYDVHSHKAFELIPKLKSFLPRAYHDLRSSGKFKIVAPDAGAATRYGDVDVVLDKKRDQLTGAISGISIKEGKVIDDDYLIVDDICDGGRTFIEASRCLYDAGAKSVHLYVTHGIFSNGLDVLTNAGIKSITTRMGKIR